MARDGQATASPRQGERRRAVASLGVPELRRLLAALHDTFTAHRGEIDRLNVFPVPDGDTGTNLVLTMRTVIDHVEEHGGDDGDLPGAVVRGALLGARGNSGVIFGQVLRGFAETLEAGGPLDRERLADAFTRSRELAYEAVARPVEGTILTAIRAAEDTAVRARQAGRELREITAETLAAVREAVLHTTEQLAVLREAGVVDAGARGFELFCACLHALAAGERVDRPAEASVAATRPTVPTHPAAGRPAPGTPANPFEVQYLVEAGDDAARALRQRLAGMGDSVVVSSAGGLTSVHVHTPDAGAAIEAGLAHGPLARIEIVYLPAQEAAACLDRTGASGTAASAAEAGVACLAVLSGAGLHEVARRSGAIVVDGRAGQLPAVGVLVDALRSVTAGRLVLLPGHPNALAAARQAARIVAEEDARPVEVVEEADSPPAVLASLAVWDPAAPEGTFATMRVAAAGCSSGEVVAAVRDADTPLGRVREGQLLAVRSGRVVAVADDPVAALVELASTLDASRSEIVTLVLGADVDATARKRAVAALEDVAAGATIEVIDGGQRPALFMLGVE